MFINIKRRNAATGTDVIVGPGPIADPISWRLTRRLDRAGSGTFTMAATDTRQGIIQPKRIAEAFAVMDRQNENALVTQGAFIIDQVERQADTDGGHTLTVSGDDLLRELANRSVGELECIEEDVRVPDWPAYGWAPELVAAITDNNPATFHDVKMDTGSMWYCGDNASFSRARFYFQSFNRTPCDMTVQYLSNSGVWTSLNITDETAVENANGEMVTWARSGDFVWDVPIDWGPYAHNGVTGWWVRWQPNADMMAAVYLAEFRVVMVSATSAALTKIMSCAPAGWGLDEFMHTRTSKAVNLIFQGESVLAALVRLAEVTGDHFRLVEGRLLQWLYEDDLNQPSVVRLVGKVDPVRGDQYGVAVITGLQFVQDTYPLVSRIYAYGAGTGANRISLAETTRSAPTGYTLNKAQNYLKRDSAETQYDRSDLWQTFQDIKPRTNGSVDRITAANALFDAVYEMLKRSGNPYNYACDIKLAQCWQTLYPGQRVRVVWHEWRNGQHVVDIDRDMLILESTTEVDQAGVRTVAIKTATIDRWPDTSALMMVRALEQLRHMGSDTYATEDYVAAQVTAGMADGALIEVRDAQNVPILRAERETSSAEFGPATTPHIEYVDGVVYIGGVSVGDLVASAGLGVDSIRTEAPIYQVATRDRVIIANDAGRVLLPDPTVVRGRVYTVKALTDKVVVTQYASEMIDGEVSQTLNTYDAITVVSDGSNWHII